MLAAALGRRRRVVQYHWGGGTPTYLSPPADRARCTRSSRGTSTIAARRRSRDRDRSAGDDGRAAGAAARASGSTGCRSASRTSRRSCRRRSTGIQPEAATRALFDAARAARLRLDQLRSDLRPAVADARVLRRHARRRHRHAARPGRRLLLRARAVDPREPEAIDPADLPPAGQKIELFVEAIESRFAAAGYRADRHGSLRAARRRAGAGARRRAACTATSWATRRARRPTWWRPASRPSATSRAPSRRTSSSSSDLLRGASTPAAFRSSAATASTPTTTSAGTSSPTLMCNFHVDVAAHRGAVRHRLRRLLRARA